MSRLRRLTALVAFTAMVSTSTASFAADNSASWAALSAMSSSSSAATQDAAVAPAGYGFWAGAIVPIGIIISAAVLAVVLARGNNDNNAGRGRGFSPT